MSWYGRGPHENYSDRNRWGARTYPKYSLLEERYDYSFTMRAVTLPE
ncbi:MAG: hypothetical protein LC649_09175 [Bacteroidales bacterium]|nr:hypothetical protein [Bacteroidales bacterium]